MKPTRVMVCNSPTEADEELEQLEAAAKRLNIRAIFWRERIALGEAADGRLYFGWEILTIKIE